LDGASGGRYRRPRSRDLGRVSFAAMRMRPAVAGPVSGRGLLLLPAGALVIHQLRYWLSYGPQTGTELAGQGHAYLSSIAPWIAMLLAGGLSCFVARLARAWRVGAGESRTRPFFKLWGTTGGGLLAIYALQETLEGVFAQGHPGGFTGVFGHGGWWAIPAAAAVSLLIVSLLRLARTLVRAAARNPRAPRRLTVTIGFRRPVSLRLVTQQPLAYAAAGRAPPTAPCAG
jgi:hypothetical protein